MQPTKPDWKAYVMEFSGLFGFVALAGLMTIWLDHPELPVMQTSLKDWPLLRRAILGVVMGIYVAVVILLAGKRSGAQVNPAVTWTFYRLGRIGLRDALCYTAAQFAGAIAASLLLRATLGRWFGHPDIHYGATVPEPPHGPTGAFLAEAIISFVLMAVTLRFITSRKLEKYSALASGILIALFLIVEAPYSGMSMNPARSFAGDLAGNQWEHLWLYFVAPVAAMLLAAQLFTRYRQRRLKKAAHDWKEIPVYPIPEAQPSK